MSRAVKTPRVSPCEPLCARLGAGAACVYPPRGSSAHTGRIPGRHKNGEYAAVTRGRPAFQRHEAHTEGSDTTPTHKCRKNAKRELLSPSPTGLPPKPSKAVSVGRGRATERASPAACGGTRDSSSARTTGQHRICLVCGEAAALPNALGGAAAPHPQAAGRSPDPLLSTIGEKHEKRYQIQHAHGVR